MNAMDREFRGFSLALQQEMATTLRDFIPGMLKTNQVILENLKEQTHSHQAMRQAILELFGALKETNKRQRNMESLLKEIYLNEMRSLGLLDRHKNAGRKGLS